MALFSLSIYFFSLFLDSNLPISTNTNLPICVNIGAQPQKSNTHMHVQVHTYTYTHKYIIHSCALFAKVSKAAMYLW